jgi:hypothetical protein
MENQLNYEHVFNHLKNLDVVLMAGLRVRPGTEFFHSLLDGHPEIIQTTGLLLSNFHDFWDTAIYKNDFNLLIEEFIYNCNYMGLFDSRFNIKQKWGFLGKNKNEYFTVDIDEFRIHLKNLMKGNQLTSNNFLLAINGAYSLCKGINVTNSKIIFLHVHSLENINKFFNIDSNTNIILMIRELRSGCLSHIENKYIKDPSYYTPNTLKDPFVEYSLINYYSSKYDVKFISLNDLHKKPKIVLQNFCNQFEIQFIPDILLESTVHKKLWWGDYLSTNDTKGFNSKFGEVEKWKDEFSNIDSYIIEFLFSEEYKILNYTTSISKLQYMLIYIAFPLFIFIPMKYEVKLLKYNVKHDMGLIRIISSFVFYLARVKMYFKVYMLKLMNKKIGIRKY